LFCNDVGKYTDGNFWYVVLFGDDVLIVGVNVALFFQGEDFIVRLGMVGRVLAAVVGSFLLLLAFFPLLLRACQITMVTLLVVLTILVVLVVAILLVVAVVVQIIAMGVVGIYSFWIARVTTLAFSWLLAVRVFHSIREDH
jgi:hypothetical protein